MQDVQQQPLITSANGLRQFACTPVAVQAIIVNRQAQVLLLSSPRRNRDGAWQVVSGALEAGETILDGTLREVYEELGGDVQVRDLGIVHAHTFSYDANVRYMTGIYTLLAYEGGAVQPGDDMAGSQFRWWSMGALVREAVQLDLPPDGLWILARAVELYSIWKDPSPTLSIG